jgi:hypothetical protein
LPDSRGQYLTEWEDVNMSAPDKKDVPVFTRDLVDSLPDWYRAAITVLSRHGKVIVQDQPREVKAA